MDLQKIVDALSSLTTLEAAKLVQTLETRWGVQVPIEPIIVPKPEPKPEPTSFDVRLTNVGADRINVIKTVKALSGRTLFEAKKLLDTSRSVVLEAVSSDAAESAKRELESHGATVELMPNEE